MNIVQEYFKDNFIVSTDPAKLDHNIIYTFLSRAYWSEGRPKEVVVRSLANSLCFGVYDGSSQIGLARVVSDYSTYAYLCDVFILEEFRSKGLGKWLISCVQSHPALKELQRWSLATRDAHGLYSQFGFARLKNPDRFMEKVNSQ